MGALSTSMPYTSVRNSAGSADRPAAGMFRERIYRNALCAVGQVVLTTLTLVVIYRIIIRGLSIQDVGVWSVVVAVSSVGRIADFGFGGGVVRSVAAEVGRGDLTAAARAVWMAAGFIGIAFGVVALVLFPFLPHPLSLIIKDPAALAKALTILPYSLITIWLSIISTVLLSALDGCGRTDLRAGIAVFGSVLQLAGTWYLLPQRGLLGLVQAQLAQGAVVLGGGIAVLAILLRPSDRSWLIWDWARLRSMMVYSGAFQLSALAQLLIDPLIKTMLAVFGGLAFTGYYELSNRIVGQFRSVVVSAYQVLLPFVAGQRLGDVQMRGAFQTAHRLLIYVIAPYYALVAILLPVLIFLWSGSLVPQFLFAAYCCFLGWAANTPNVAAHFFYMGAGKTLWPVATQLAIGILNLLCGWILALAFGGAGVLVGAAAALGLGSFVVVIAFCLEYGIPLRDILPRESARLVAASLVISAVAAVFAFMLGRGRLPWSVFGAFGAGALGVLTVMVWRHPQRQRLQEVVGRILTALRAPAAVV